MTAVLGQASDGGLVRKAGVMAVVVTGGEVRLGDTIALESMPLAYQALEPV